MAKRPPLSDSTFLGHVFSPKKNPQPTGLRKTSLRGTAGRNPRRLKAYNKLSAVNQEILKKAGTRDAYLKGETTLAEAKRKLRDTAVKLGVAKPLRVRHPRQPFVRTHLDRLVAKHIRDTIIDAGVNFNTVTSEEQMEYLEPEEQMLDWDYGRIKHAGRTNSEYETVGADGKRHNPFWYH